MAAHGAFRAACPHYAFKSAAWIAGGHTPPPASLRAAPSTARGRVREGGEVTPLLHTLRTAAPRAVWLAASMLYRGDDARRLARLKAIAAEASVPLIAVGDVLYHVPERRPLQDVVTCIREHVTIDQAGRRLEANAERHLKTPAEMARLFRAAPNALAETEQLIERCGFSLDALKSTEYPDETRQGYATLQDALRTVGLPALAIA